MGTYTGFPVVAAFVNAAFKIQQVLSMLMNERMAINGSSNVIFKIKIKNITKIKIERKKYQVNMHNIL
jgi:hypothetical protein